MENLKEKMKIDKDSKIREKAMKIWKGKKKPKEEFQEKLYFSKRYGVTH